jgi:hypothetical protein
MSGPMIQRVMTKRFFIDSRDSTAHHNNNPSEYTIELPKLLPNVRTVRLLEYNVPYSPTFVVIRTSKWHDAGYINTVELMDDIHQFAVDLAEDIPEQSVETSDRVATIYKPDGTVSLNIQEVFTFVRTRSSDNAFRTYDVFICTGTLLTSSRTGWLVQDPEGSSDCAMSGTDSDTRLSDVGYAATSAGESSIAVNVIQEKLYLDIDVGSANNRLTAVQTVYPQWKSFQVYRQGDFVCYGDSCYVCQRSHMSLIFDEDVISNWALQSQITATPAANNAFTVIQPQDDNEALVTRHFAPDEQFVDVSRVDVSQITVRWRTRRGTHYLFPYAPSIEFLSFSDPSNVAEMRREYRHHSMVIELEYEEPTGIPIPPNSTVTHINRMPNFLQPSSAARW